MISVKEFYRTVKKALVGSSDALNDALDKFQKRSAGNTLPYSKTKELLEHLEWHREVIDQLQEALEWNNRPATEETWFALVQERTGTKMTMVFI